MIIIYIVGGHGFTQNLTLFMETVASGTTGPGSDNRHAEAIYVFGKFESRMTLETDLK